jgi:hypothetical protein
MLDGIKKKLFGGGATPQSRKTSEHLDAYGPDNMPDGCLAALWELHAARYPNTLKLLEQSRKAMNGEIKGAVAPEWDADDRDVFRTGGPEAWERPRKTAKRLAAKKARVKRPNTRLNPKAQEESTRIEQFDNAVLDVQFPDYPATEMSLNEGWSLFVCMPTPISYRRIPTLYDEFEEESPFLKADEYDKAPPSRKREYARASKDGDAPTYKRLRKKYRRSKDGEPDDGSDAFELDEKRTAREFEDALDDAFARNLPIQIRGPISFRDFKPIDPVWSGSKTLVEGAIIRTRYRKSRLKRLFTWDGCDELIEPVGPDGGDGEFFLYELWAYDEWHRPYCAYQVGTKNASYARPNRYGEEGQTAVIKLWEAFPGITELPISVEPGDYIATSDLDKAVLPFPIPYIDNWRQRNSLMDTMTMAAQKYGFPSFVQELTPESLDVLERLGGEVDIEFKAAPNTVHRVFGKVSPLGPSGPAPVVGELLQALDALNEKELPQQASFGGEGASSGLDRQIIGRDTEIVHGPVIEAVRRHKEAMGRHVLMVASALGKAADRPVETYVIGTAPNPQSGGTTTTRTVISLPPDICDDNWDVVAQFETEPGEHLAQASLFMEMFKIGVILEEEFREWALGDANPEIFRWKKVIEDYFKSPAGMMDIMKGAAEYIADDKLAQAIELTNSGKLTDPMGGTSQAAMDSLLGGGGAPGGSPTGMTLNTNPGQAALAGANGAAMSADAASYGSPTDGAMGPA